MTNRKFYAQYCPYGINVSYASMGGGGGTPTNFTPLTQRQNETHG